MDKVHNCTTQRMDIDLEENLPQGRKFRQLIQLFVTFIRNAWASYMWLKKSSGTVENGDGL